MHRLEDMRLFIFFFFSSFSLSDLEEVHQYLEDLYFLKERQEALVLKIIKSEKNASKILKASANLASGPEDTTFPWQVHPRQISRENTGGSRGAAPGKDARLSKW